MSFRLIIHCRHVPHLPSYFISMSLISLHAALLISHVSVNEAQMPVVATSSPWSSHTSWRSRVRPNRRPACCPPSRRSRRSAADTDSAPSNRPVTGRTARRNCTASHDLVARCNDLYLRRSVTIYRLGGSLLTTRVVHVGGEHVTGVHRRRRARGQHKDHRQTETWPHSGVSSLLFLVLLPVKLPTWCTSRIVPRLSVCFWSQQSINQSINYVSTFKWYISIKHLTNELNSKFVFKNPP